MLSDKVTSHKNCYSCLSLVKLFISTHLALAYCQYVHTRANIRGSLRQDLSDGPSSGGICMRRIELKIAASLSSSHDGMTDEH